MKVFAWTFLLVLGGQYATVLALNLVANPRGEFPTHVVEPLTNRVEDEKLHAFSGLEKGPRALILGSSRIWSAPPATLDALGQGPAFNFAVPGGTMRHARGLYEYALAHGADPRVVYVGAEDWMLEDWSDASWRPDGKPTLADVETYAAPLAASYEWNYVQDSKTALAHAVFGAPPRPIAVAEDGHVEYEVAEAQMAAGSYDWASGFRANIRPAEGIYERVASLDPALVADLDALLALAKSHGARVVLVMTPFLQESADAASPGAFARLHAEAREALVARCDAGVAVYDFTDYRDFGGDRAQFVDGWHYTALNGDRLLRAAQDPGLDLCAT